MARESPHDGERACGLWGGRFSEETDARVADFTRSIEVDAELARRRHRGLDRPRPRARRAGLLTDDEVDDAGRRPRRRWPSDVAAGRLAWDPALEDVHLNLEAALAERVGPVAGKLHTGRSRNDQVATDLRLWTRRAIDELDAALVDFERALVDLAEREGTAVLPGHDPHPAGPAGAVRPSPARLRRDGRARPRPAGRCARRGSTSRRSAPARWPAPATRSTARRPPPSSASTASRANSLDAVSDRDFVVEVLAAVALGMVHLSRLAEELTWWSNPRFGFVRVADAFSTGSSMMPNKKNPDPAELVRGRAARVIGELTGALTLLKGLPLAYQRDLQEDKAPLFDAVAVFEALAAGHGRAASRR